MRWQISYRKKGDNSTLTKTVDLHYEDKDKVRSWFNTNQQTFVPFLGSKTVGGNRMDLEFINAKKI